MSTTASTTEVTLTYNGDGSNNVYTTAELAVKALREAGLGETVYLPGDKQYENRIESYWSRTSQLRPWAIVQPRDSLGVSAAIRALVATPGCQIAIRSGGHMASPGASSIEDGVTIDLGLLNNTTYNVENNLASLEPSARWGDVYAKLEKCEQSVCLANLWFSNPVANSWPPPRPEDNVMVAGGRERDVAVAGFLLGGGTSLYTCRFGFGCDQVVNFEVVLADGRITQANCAEHVDLFKVLKGGGNNFGIVTRFDMQAFPASPCGIWDAVMTYPVEAEDQFLKSYHDFTKSLNHKPDAHLLPFVWAIPSQLVLDVHSNMSAQWFSSTKSQQPVITAILTSLDGSECNESLGKFKTITGAETVKSGVTTVNKKMETLATPPGEYTTCNLVLKLDMRILRKIAKTHSSMISKFAKCSPHNEVALYFVVHPFPAIFGQNSAANGGNIMGIETIEDDCILLQASLATDNLHRSAYFPTFKEGLDELEEFACSTDKLVEFRYLNYSDISQDPLSTYGENNVKQMQKVAKKYDPDGIFQARVPGGFKISKVEL